MSRRIFTQRRIVALMLALSLGLGTLLPQPAYAEKKPPKKAAAESARSCEVDDGVSTTRRDDAGNFTVDCNLPDGGGWQCGFSNNGGSTCTYWDENGDYLDPSTGQPAEQKPPEPSPLNQSGAAPAVHRPVQPR